MIATEIKLFGIGASLAAVIGLVIFVPNHYKNEGRKEVHAEYAEATRIAIVKRNAEIERLKLEQTEINRKVVADYENKLKSLSDRLADARRIGLRVPKSTCDGFTATPEATSAKRDNETEYVRLPERIESGLFRIAERAEEINIQLSACQNWIIQNGFFQTSKPNTQD